MPVHQYTRQQYLDAIERNGGSRVRAAAELGVGVRQVFKTLKACKEQGSDIRPAYAPVDAHNIARLESTIEDLRGQLEAVTMVKRWAAKPSTRTAPKPRGTKHMYVPDTQIKCGVPINHLTAAGNYAVEKRPDTIVLAGDWWDFPSLSSYDRGKLCFEGRRYRLDVEAGKAGLEKFLAPIRKAKNYHPRIVMTLGNHENRAERAVQEDSRLEGLMGLHDLQLDAFGVESHEFLKTVVIDGIAYCHYFPRSASGAVGQSKRGAPNAKAQLVREGRTAVAGHQQGLEMHCQPLGGRLQWGVIAGSFYQHHESYLTPQGNDHWRGLLMFHEVRDGSLTPMVVSMDYLLDEYQ
jgi:hypothetical protein